MRRSPRKPAAALSAMPGTSKWSSTPRAARSAATAPKSAEWRCSARPPASTRAAIDPWRSNPLTGVWAASSASSLAPTSPSMSGKNQPAGGPKMKRFLETGNFAITEGAILAGCRFFCGYPITPATELAEAMSMRLPQVGGVYLQAEDECAAMHLCIGASLGGMKAMTATSGPGFILYADPYGWALGCETPMVVLNSGRVGPVSGITGAPGQGEFYLTRYPTQGGNFETVVLAPNSAQESMKMVVESFYLSERLRMPVTVLADQLITDGMEDISVPENEAEMKEMGFRTWPRTHHKGPDFYPFTDALDIPPVQMGYN